MNEDQSSCRQEKRLAEQDHEIQAESAAAINSGLKLTTDATHNKSW